MDNKNKRVFSFLIVLFVLLVGIATVSATNVSNDTSIVSSDSNTTAVSSQVTVNNQEKVISEDNLNKINSTNNKDKLGASSTVYVNANTGKDTNSGTSSSSAYKTINRALYNNNEYGYKVNRTIYVSAGTYTLKNLNIRYSNVEIIGSGIDKTIINGNGASVISSAVFSNITLRNLTIRNGYNSTASVLNLNNEVHTTISNVKFYNNTGKYGGVIRNIGSTNRLVITSSTFDKNTAKNRGGAIETNSAYEYIRGCTFTNNVAEESSTSLVGYGGAIYKAGENKLYLLSSTFNNNNARRGGSIYLIELATMEINGCTFTNNIARASTNNLNNFISGGAIYVGSGYTNVVNSVFRNNKAQQGGAISINSDTKQNITGSKFINNTAYFRAGAIYNDGVLNIYKSSFDNNTAGSYGGILYSVDTSDRIYIYDSNFTNNRATGSDSSGGVIYLVSTKSFLLFDNCIFKSNYAVNGGVIGTFSQSGIIKISNSKFESNTASSNGGVINARAVNLDLAISNSSIKNSKSTSEGGSFYFSGTDSNYDLDNVNITNSVSNSKGGAIYIRNYAHLDIYESIFKNCKATEGGAIFNNILPVMNIKYSTFENNTATPGSAIYNYKATGSTVNYNNFINNKNSTIYSPFTKVTANYNYWSSGSKNTGITNSNARSSAIKSPTKYTLYVNANSGSDSNAGTNAKPLKTLSAAVKKYSSADVTIYLSKGTYTAKNITISSDTKIVGAGSSNTIITGSNSPLFTSSATRFTLRSLTLTNGSNIKGIGGVISVTNSYSKITIENSVVKNNKAMYGGVIASINPNIRITLTNSTFTNNSATTGGIIYSSSNETVLFVDSVNITNSNSVGNGGSFDLEGADSNHNFFNVKFTNSVSNMNGGAICVNNSGYLVLQEVSFNKCKALYGGAVYINTSKKLFGRNSDFKNNYALKGGAIYHTVYGNLSENPLEPFVQYSTLKNNTNLSIYSNRTLSAIYNWWGSNNGNNTINSYVNAKDPILFNMSANIYEFDKIRFKYVFNTFNHSGVEKDVNGLLNPVSISSNDTRLKTISTNQVKNVDTNITAKTFSKIKFTLDNQVITIDNSLKKSYSVNTITNPSTVDKRSNIAFAFSVGSLKVGTTSQIKVTVTNNSGTKINRGNVYVKLNGNFLRYDGSLSSNKALYTAEVKNGVATLNITPTSSYLNYKTLQVIYPENDLYKAKNSTVKSISVTNNNNTAVTSANIFINSLNVLNSKYVLTTQVTDGNYNNLSNGRVSYSLDGKWIGSVDVEKGSSWISFNTPSAGNHTIQATYINTKGTTITTDKYTFTKTSNVNTLFNTYNVKNGKVIIITTVKNDKGANLTSGRVSYTLNGKWIGSIDVKSGTSWINFDYKNTTYNFTATYITNKNVKQSIYTETLNLSKLNSFMNQKTTSDIHIMINSLNVVNSKYVLTTQVTTKNYTKLNTGRVSYTLDGKWVGSVNVEKGSSWISFNVPSVGTHTLVATYVDAKGNSLGSDTYTFKKVSNVNMLFNAYNVKNGKVIVTTSVKNDKGANINSGRISYTLNGKWIGSIDVKNGTSWISFNYTNTITTFAATYLSSSNVQQNTYNRTLNLTEISSLRKLV